MKWWTLVLLAGACGPALGPTVVKALEVPLSVVELRPADVPAVGSRPPGVVRAGVPIAPEEDLRNVGELGLLGSPAAQFRVLQRDLETGAIRWVQVSFVDTGTGPYRLVRGSGAFGGAPLAQDATDHILVDTGVAQFVVRKDRFRFLDEVRTPARTWFQSRARGVVVQAAGEIYSSALDDAPRVRITENGPVVATLQADGVLRNASGGRHLAYTVRMQFERGQTGCRAWITLRNAELAALSVKTFDAAWVEFPASATGPRSLHFGTSRGDVVLDVLPGTGAHLVQGDNVFQRSSRTGRLTPYLTPLVGMEIATEDSVFVPAGVDSDYARGWMEVADDTGRMLLGMRDFATWFPGGFTVNDSVIALELFSRFNPQRDLVFSWGAHETREVLLAFDPDPALDAPTFGAELQYPRIARAPFEHYRDSGGVFGETRLVTVDEERAFFGALGKSWDFTPVLERDIRAQRQWSFSTTGGSNQFDKDLARLLDWLRTGDPGTWLQARFGVMWKADQAVLHSDDFDYGVRQRAVSDVDVVQPKTFHGKGAGNLFDDEHPHWVCMPLYYWLTGDERIRDAMVDYGEWRRYRAGNPDYGAIHGGAIKHFRLWSRAFRDIALLYEITQQPRYLEDLRRMAQVLTGTLEVAGSRGRNLDRGYFYFGNPDDPNRRIHLFFLTEMNPIGVKEALRVLPRTDPLREALRDYLEGLAWFTLREAQVLPDASGYPYGYYAAIPNTVPGNRGDQTGILLTHGYENTGNAEFIERARRLTWRVVQDQNPMRASELSTHLRIYRWRHRDAVGARLIDPVATPNGDGTWTLQWTAPPNARAYIVKYGPRPLVDNLDFDQLTRTFRVDPDSAMNFWAASNLPGEPRPGLTGASETFRTPVLPPGNWFFKVRALLKSASNHPPATQDDFGSTMEDMPVQLAVLANDADIDGALLPSTLRVITPPERGTAQVDSILGEIVYTPMPDSSGNDRFEYVIDDDAGATSYPAEVIVQIAAVNDPPVARDDSVTTPEDTAVSVDLLANDIDVDNALLAANLTLVDPPRRGTLAIETTGMARYVPAPDTFGDDRARYLLIDAAGASSDTATVVFHVLAVNDPPTARDDSVTTLEDTATTVDVLSNDLDIDGRLVRGSLRIVQAPASVIARPDSLGNLEILPPPDWYGLDSLRYVVRDDGGAESAPATLRIVVTPVNDPPVARDDSVTTLEDTPVGLEVLANDEDIDGALDPAALQIATTPAHGRLLQNGGTTDWRYIPDPDVYGTDVFSYRIADDTGALSNLATVRVDIVPVSDVPFAATDSASVAEDSVITIPVLANDRAPDGPLIPSSVTIVRRPMHGTASVDSTGTIRFAPAINFAGRDSLQYTVTDSTGQRSPPAPVRVTVLARNDPPVARPDSVEAAPDMRFEIDVLANDSDVDGDTLLVDAVDAARVQGEIRVSASRRTLVFVAPGHTVERQTFRYTVIDPAGATAEATVVLTMTSTPVRVSEFTAQIVDRGIVLSWWLENTQDIVGLRVHRSVNDAPLRLRHAEALAVRSGRMQYVDNASDLHAGDTLVYRLEALDASGGSLLLGVSARVVYAPVIPRHPGLSQNHPNPFNPHTRIPFALTRTARTTLRIYDVTGRHVVTLLDATLVPGHYHVDWDGTDAHHKPMASGTYFYRLRSGRFTQTRRLNLVR